MSKAFTQYLKQYAEPESQVLSDFSQTWDETYQYALTLPVYKEPITAIQRFIDFCNMYQQILLVLVINRPDTDNNTQWLENYYTYLNQQLGVAESTQDKLLHRYSLSKNNHLLLIDRGLYGEAIPHKKGVGLARKIAADCISSLIYSKKVLSPWIFNTDADVHLPDNYFTVTKAISEKNSGLVFNFKHQNLTGDAPQKATELYERWLHSYVDGLRYAGSPYAFHTIGSIIVINCYHYVQARGFPTRAGAEDFYLLNKLVKLAPIKNVESTIVIESRFSERVPFGTGPAVQAISNNEKHSYQTYPSHCFEDLKQWLSFINKSAEQPELESAKSLINKEQNDFILKQINEYNFSDILEKSFKQCSTTEKRKKYLHDWFDAFKTLKLINSIIKDP